MLSVTLALILVALSISFIYSKWRHRYWYSRGIDGPPATFIIGHFTQLYLGRRWEYIQKCYFKYKNKKVFGVYEGFKPFVFICDPAIIKQVLVKDFDYFSTRREFEFPKQAGFLAEMLSNVNGDSWKKLRSTMSPTFSTGKIKTMYTIVDQHANDFLQYIHNSLDDSNKLDMKDAFGRFTIDVIAESAFGIKCDSLKKEDAAFAEYGDLIFGTSLYRSLVTGLFGVYPKLSMFLSIFEQIIFRPKNPWLFFLQVSHATMESRKKESIKRHDFLNTMLEEQEKQTKHFDPEKDYRITNNTITSETILFLIAGYDTVSNTLSVTSYHLAKNPNIQNLLREELQAIIKEHGSFNYHNIMDAKYLDACISEALRVTPVPWLERTCTKDYKVEGTDIAISKGTIVGIPLWGLHLDPKYWTDPETYNPERFLPENKNKIEPFTYMPFGMGPRNCIAMRFALMEAKLCLAHFVLNYSFNLAPGYQELKIANGSGIVKVVKDSVVLNLTSLIKK